MQAIIRRLFYSLFYFRQPPWDTGVSPPELVAFVRQNPPGRALDLGCGTGTNAVYLAQHGWQVSGVDFVGRAIRTARRKARQARLAIDFHHADVTRLEGIHGPFDLILDIGCFHSLTAEGRAAYVKNLERLLAPKGTFLMYAYFRLEDETPNALGGGLLESDLQLFERGPDGPRLRLVERQDGDERGLRPSAWFWYQR